MKYLRLFPSDADYQQYKEGDSYVTPNVSLITENNNIYFNPVPPPPPPAAGDIVYYKESSLKTVKYTDWKTELGTPVGVVVIPEGFAPDGKARMVALSGVTSGGTASNSNKYMIWGPTSTDTTLTNYTKVPTTDNAGSTNTGSADYAYLPSDKFTGPVSYVDPKSKYYGSPYTQMIPSPYLTVDGKNEFNPEYYKAISGNNALSDFSGKANTQTLVGLGTGYTAANACWKYKDAANSGTQWYLPAMGELGYMVLRLNEIQAGLSAVSAVQLDLVGDTSFSYWSSSEKSTTEVHTLTPYSGRVGGSTKNSGAKYDDYLTRPFAIVE